MRISLKYNNNNYYYCHRRGADGGPPEDLKLLFKSVRNKPNRFPRRIDGRGDGVENSTLVLGILFCIQEN